MFIQDFYVILTGPFEITAGGSITRYAYLDTVRECGIITKLIETKLKGIPVPLSKLMMNIGCLTGDVIRLRGQRKNFLAGLGIRDTIFTML